MGTNRLGLGPGVVIVDVDFVVVLRVGDGGEVLLFLEREREQAALLAVQYRCFGAKGGPLNNAGNFGYTSLGSLVRPLCAQVEGPRGQAPSAQCRCSLHHTRVFCVVSVINMTVLGVWGELLFC